MNTAPSPGPVATPLPELAPQNHVDRRLTVSEYYHAAMGCHPQSHIRAHDVIIILEGIGTIDPTVWQAALNQTAEANPGARLRLVGKRQKARWISDGLPPQLRIVDGCLWDGFSSEGTEALFNTDLDLEAGRTAEVIIARTRPEAREMKVIFRTSHAAMDGVGTLHIMYEMFRALRGEPLLGSNASYTDTDLMRNGPKRTAFKAQIEIADMMGGVQGEERGGIWRRITLSSPQPNLLPRIAAILTEYARRHSDKTARIGIPTNLRRHAPELLTTMNFTGMTYLDMPPDITIDSNDIKSRLKDLRDGNADINYRKIFEVMRYLPFAWVDGMVSINDKNYRSPNLHETAILSVLGTFKKTIFSGGGFAAESMYCVPQLENVFVAVSGLQGNFEISIGMPRVFASNGRLDDLLDLMLTRLDRSNSRVNADSDSASD